MPEQAEQDRFRTNLPWYVSGRLDRDEHSWMEDYLSRYPECQNEVRRERLLRSVMQEGEIAYDGRAGLPDFLQRIRDDSSTPWISRWLDRFGLRAGSPAVAVFASLLVLQLGLTAALYSRSHVTEPDPERWRSAGSATTQGPVLRITFKPEAQERQLRLLLVRIHGIIVGGPGQLGNYIVKVPAETIDAVQKQVADEEFVESIEKLNDVPTPD